MSLDVVQVTATVDLNPDERADKVVSELREWLEEERLEWRLDLVGPSRLRVLASWPIDQLSGGALQSLAFTTSELDRALTSLDFQRSLGRARVEALLISAPDRGADDEPEEY